MPPAVPPDAPLDLPAIIQRCAPNVGLETMRAIVHVESRGRAHVIGYKVVHPNGVFHLTRTPANREEAIAWARWMLDKGYKFDAGPAQINSTNFRAYGLTPENVFDPCTNIRAGAAILTESYRNASRKFGPGRQALLAAISAYNSGNYVTGFRNGYVQKVTAAAGRQPAVPAASSGAGVAPPLRALSGGPAPVISKPSKPAAAMPPAAAPATAPAPKSGPAAIAEAAPVAFYANPANPLTVASEVDAFRSLNMSAGFDKNTASADQ